MNTAIRVRAVERNRRIFFPSERPAAAPSRGGLLRRFHLAAKAALGLRG
jgi:hypothetical protein